MPAGRVSLVLALLGLGVCANGAGDTYLIGTGRYDVTGPAAEVEMMGYAMPTQITHGIHFRQWSRAFIVAESSDSARVVFVNVDICMGTQVLKMQVVEKLQAKYGNVYTNDNVLISGIHTHSGPAGYFQYLLFEVMSLGFVKESLDAVVDGVVASIQAAHENMRPGKLFLNSGLLADANINRSPTAYMRNPKEERERYLSVGNDTDHNMVVLKMMDADGGGIGMIDWFAVHCTSMNNTNPLISGDNKGYASYLMEEAMSPLGTLPGRGKFLAAFAQSNEGDVSPNTRGPRCLDTGKLCDVVHSTCNGKNELCVASGPGVDMFDSTRIIGEKQFNKGKSLYDEAKKPISGPIQFRHSFVDFSKVQLNISGNIVHTCPPAMGEAFAAGTTDGPGAFDFKQASNTTNPIWLLVRDFLHKPTKEQIECHAPKPILLDTGYMDFPYPWQAKILPLQLLRIGQLVIIGVPAEFTTMSGRKARETVRNILIKHGEKEGFNGDTETVIAGLSNTYADYVTTFAEYQEQRYEAASTAYGPYTLDAYLSEFSRLAMDLATNKESDPGPDPPNYLDKQLSIHPPVLYDFPPFGKSFGDVHKDAEATYETNDTVEVEFWAGNPRNDLMTEKTFLTVERKNSSVSGGWTVVCTDGSWETRFKWYHTGIVLAGESLATITWTIPPSTTTGEYRVRHFGNSKSPLGHITSYTGTSRTFSVKGK